MESILEDKQAIKGILKLIKEREYIQKAMDYYRGNSNYSCSSSSDHDYEAENEDCAFDIAMHCDLRYLGAGYSRGVIGLSSAYVAKLQLNESCECNEKEYLLHSYVKRNKPHLSQYLLPPICKFDSILIMPYCENIRFKLSGWVEGTIESLFAREGVILEDVYHRGDNWGMYQGRLVIRDYGEWEFCKDIKHYV